MNPADVKTGQRIRVTQRIGRRESDWKTAVTGVVVSTKLEKTGSWYAHSKGDRYWLMRVRLQKDDGEITTLTIDQFSQVDLLGEAAAPAS